MFLTSGICAITGLKILIKLIEEICRSKVCQNKSHQQNFKCISIFMQSLCFLAAQPCDVIFSLKNLLKSCWVWKNFQQNYFMLKIWTQRNRNIRCFEQDQHASSSVPETMHTNWPFCNLWLITVDCWTKMQRFCCPAQHILHFISLAMNLLHYLLQHINRMDSNMYVLSPCHEKRKSFDIYLSVFNSKPHLEKFV